MMFKAKKFKVVFISHESSMSGAPILLLNLLKLLKTLDLCSFIIVIKRGGVLDNSFAELGETIVLKPGNYQLNKSLAGKVLDYLLYKRRLRKVQKKISTHDFIFNNTIANGRLLKLLSNQKKPIITYVHELDKAMKFCDIHKDTTLSLKISKAFFSPVNIVTNNLIENYKIPAASIHPLYYYFEPVKEVLREIKEQKKIAFLNHYKIPLHKFYVVGMGAAALRKGIDLFIKICKEVIACDQNIHFVWIGDFIEEEIKNQMSQLIEDISDYFTITGFIPNDIENLLPFDVFALTSREDPYPLVVLESAYLKIPAISFSGTGGMDIFIDNDAGFLIPDNSVSSFAKKILQLKNNSDLVKEKGLVARNKVMKLHSDENIIVQQFLTGVQCLNTDN